MSFKITLKSEKEKIVVFSQGEETLEEHMKKVFSNIVSDAEFKVANASYIKAGIEVGSVGSETYMLTFMVEDTDSEKMISATEIFKSNIQPEKIIQEKMPELADFKKIELLTGDIHFQ